MNIFQSCCFLPSKSAFIFAAGFVEGSKQQMAEEMRKCKVQVFLFKPQRLLEIQIVGAEEWRGLWRTVKKLWFRFSSNKGLLYVPSALLRWLQLIQSGIWSASASAGISLFFTWNSARQSSSCISSRSKSGYELYGRRLCSFRVFRHTKTASKTLSTVLKLLSRIISMSHCLQLNFGRLRQRTLPRPPQPR